MGPLAATPSSSPREAIGRRGGGERYRIRLGSRNRVRGERIGHFRRERGQGDPGVHDGQEHAYDAESDEYEGCRSVDEDDDSDEGEFGDGPEENEASGSGCEMATVTTSDDGDAAPETVEFDLYTHDNEHEASESLKAPLPSEILSTCALQGALV